MFLRRIFYLIFLIVLACSKDKDEEPEYVVKNYDVSIETTEGGTVSYAGGSIQAGQTVTVNATPSDGYKFTGWSGDATGNENPLTVTVYSNTNITANFERIKYVLNVGVVGSGQVSQTIVSSSKKGEEYNAGTVIRLNANPNSGSLFTTWSGSTTETSSEIDITIDGTKSVTATFEEQIFNLVNQDNVFIGTGRWKIRKPKTGDRGSGKLNHCEITELIFRKDGTFTIVFSDLTVAGIYRVSQSQTSSFSIDLSVARNNYGKIDNLTLTNNFISFRIASSDCDKSVQADKDKDYDESKDPLACKIEGNLLSGPQTQIVSPTQSISEVKYEFSTNCPQLINSSVSNLPPGVTMSFVDNIATISGAPTSQASGVYNYLISLDNALSATATDPAAPASAEFSIEGTIEVTNNVSQTTCSQASITLIDGNPSPSITLGEPIGTIVWELSTDCPRDANGVSLNSSASGLPSGVTYSFSGQDNRIFVQGTPTSVGTYSYNIVYYNDQQLSNSSVVASVTGVITVNASSTTSSTTCSADPCSITGALVSGAQSLTTTVSTDSILVRYDFTNTCSQVLQASVTGLPPGVTYIIQEVDANLAYVQLRGIPTSVGTYTYTISVDNSLIATASAPACAATASTTISGSISVVASPTCTQASISLVSGNPNQNITLGNSIANVTWGLNTDCPPDGNGVPLNSSASGLPPGVIYSFSGQSQQIFLSGTPTSVGTYSYNIVYYNAQQLSNSTVVASVTGVVAISSAVATNCSVSGAITSGNANQTITDGQSIADIVGAFSSSCSYTLTSNTSGLPSGLTSTFNNNQLLITGTPNSGAGTYTYQVAVYDNPPSGQTSSLLTVGGTLTINASSTSATSSQTWTLDVTAQNSSDYQLSGNDRNGTVTGNDPTITIALGDTLTFNVNAGGHPFYLKTQAGTGTANQVSGATNQGTENGIVTWTPTATGTYYYICSLHGAMSGTIIVQ